MIHFLHYIMRNAIFLFKVIFLVAFFGHSQSSMRRYYSDEGSISNDLVVTKDNGYAVVGYSNFYFNTNIQRPFILKVDSIGQTLWQRHFTDFLSESSFNRVIELPDSSIVIAGQTNNQLQVTNSALVLRLDIDGNLIWKKKIDFNGVQCSVKEVLFCADSTIIVAGVAGDYSFWINLDLSGNKISGYKVDLNNSQINTDFSIKTVVKGDRNVKYFAGKLNDDGFLFMLDSSNSFVWFKRISLTNYSLKFTDLFVENDGLLIRTDGSGCDIIKTDFNGNPLWAKQVTDGNASFDMEDRKMLRLTDGNYLVYSADMALGKLVALNTFGEPFLGLSMIGKLRAVRQDKEGRILMLINGPGIGVRSFLSQQHFVVEKIDSLKNAGTNCSWIAPYSNILRMIQSFDETLVLSDSIQINDATMDLINYSLYEDNACIDLISNSEEKNSEEIVLIQNPVNETIKITSLIDECNIFITDFLGNTVYNTIISGERNIIDISNLADGVYFLNFGNSKTKFLKN